MQIQSGPSFSIYVSGYSLGRSCPFLLGKEKFMKKTKEEKKGFLYVWKPNVKPILKPAAVWLFLAVLVLGFPLAVTAQLPCYNIDVVGNHFYCANWLPNAPLYIAINSVIASSTITDSTGFAVFSLALDVKGGDLVTVWDENTTISYTIANVTVDNVDTCNDIISGRADPGSKVTVVEDTFSIPPMVPQMIVYADASGHWIADYGSINEDLMDGDRGVAFQATNVYPIYCSSHYNWRAGPCAPSVGEIVSYTGDVLVNDVPIRDLGSLQLEIFDTVRTLSDGYVEAQLGETMVNIDHDSGVTVAETTLSTMTSLEVLYGGLMSRVRNASGHSFEIKTPVAVSSVRGTEMLVEATPGEARIFMLEHDADVSTSDGSQNLVLQELQGVVVTTAGIGEPFPISPNEIERWWEQLVISVASPVNLFVTDPLGRHIGCSPSGEIVNEIPGAFYSGPSAVPEEVTIAAPVKGDYDIELIPVGTGDYHLTVAGMGLGEETFLNEYSGSVEESGDTVHLEEGYEPEEEFLQVEIDIKPGDFPNVINPKSKGRIPVAILTDENFNAANVDWATVSFGVLGTEAESDHHALEDVDGDGDLDMILHFRTQDTGFQFGDTSAYLRGLTLDAREFEGYDSIKTVGLKKK